MEDLCGAEHKFILFLAVYADHNTIFPRYSM